MIKSVRKVGIDHTWDISIEGDEYILPNGVVSHNTSAQVANATNGIEPVRALIIRKKSDDGVPPQVVPCIETLAGAYDMLWDQRSPIGYLNICAVLQKYIDQAISVNISYNPEHYPEHDNKVPLKDMLDHVMHFYKFGGKNLYYNNTHDEQGEVDVDATINSIDPEETIGDDDDCDSCKI